MLLGDRYETLPIIMAAAYENTFSSFEGEKSQVNG